MDHDQRDSSVQRPGARWFVSAPAKTDVRPLLARLQRRGVRPFLLSDVADLGTDLRTSVQAAISAADRVLVVLSGDVESANQMFEAGLALGLGKPVVVLADSAASVPTALQSQLTIRANASDVEAIDFALDQASGRILQPLAETPAGGHPLGSRVDELLARVRALSNAGAAAIEGTIVEILVEAIEQTGSVSVPAGAGDLGYDIGIWSDDLDAIAANPLVIEIKRRLSTAGLRRALNSLQDKRGPRLALLVYLEGAPSDAGVLREVRPPVLAIAIVELLERLRTSSFAEVVRDLRNQSVHGWSTS